MTYEDLKKANKQLDTINVKGKEYVQVNERVKAFRMICPNGQIETEMILFEAGRVMFKATIRDEEGNLLATGYSEEKEGSTMINKTSFVENCETSAVGRALGFAGIGIDGSMASAEEVATAIVNQNKPAPKPQPQYPPEFLDACKLPAGGMTMGKLYKENRSLFDNLMKTGTIEEQAAAEIILEYMKKEGKA